MSTRSERLIERVCGPRHPLAPSLHHWGLTSGAFLAFVESNESKFRRKVRQAGDPAAQLDLLAEWAVARHFLADRRFTVQYEPRRAEGGRSADLGVTFKTHTPLQVEVTRLRAGGSALDIKLARVLSDKVGQLAPGSANLLVVSLPPDDGPLEGAADTLLAAAFKVLNNAAASPLPPEAGRDFQRGRPRLGAVWLVSDPAELRDLHLWVNAQAKHPLPAEVLRFLHP
ncbi:hypothetical protein D3875_11860 [Deinococcus cavernae]|uniref:DUF1837 domain-containing protein n=1 Tax=Deinococcus cavernae TaxID=2320857 RepID=A0A418V7R7_9DEIO|nr:hypothetical protein [Deinococcus cavernae]RJF72142.1 hypothetical protein D3875_11860 [Deinococcus cavernae]